MDLRLLATVFATVFIAELGDKTQLATFLYASDKAANKWVVFTGAALALILASAMAVLAGSLVSHYLSPRILSTAAGMGFVAVGLWTLWQAWM